MEAKSFTEQWLTQAVMERLRETGERVEAQGSRIGDLAARIGKHDDRLSRQSTRLGTVEQGLAEIKTTIKTVGWIVGGVVPIASALLIKVIG